MTDHHDISDTHDICLLLRAHGEQRWLISEVLPVLREIEQPSSIPEDQLGAALAYLEVLWLDARGRAAETDAACTHLDVLGHELDRTLYEEAHGYCLAVRCLRDAIGRRVIQLTRLDAEAVEHEHANR